MILQAGSFHQNFVLQVINWHFSKNFLVSILLIFRHLLKGTNWVVGYYFLLSKGSEFPNGMKSLFRRIISVSWFFPCTI